MLKKYLNTLLLDFWLVPFVNISFSRLTLPLYVFCNVNRILAKTRLVYWLFPVALLFSGWHLEKDMLLFWAFIRPLFFGVVFFHIGMLMSSRDFGSILRNYVLLAILANTILYVITPAPEARLSLFKLFNFAAIQGDLNLIREGRWILPSGNPARLGFVVGLALVFFSSQRVHLKSLASFISVLMSGARSALFGIVVVFLRRNLKVLLLSSVLIYPLVLFLISLDLRVFNFSEESLLRHFLLRERTLECISRWSMMDWIFGVGIGQSEHYIMGSYSFTVLLTIVFETGLLGLLSFLAFFTRRILLNPIGIYLFSVMLLYEVKPDPFFWLSLGFIKVKTI